MRQRQQQKQNQHQSRLPFFDRSAHDAESSFGGVTCRVTSDAHALAWVLEDEEAQQEHSLKSRRQVACEMALDSAAVGLNQQQLLGFLGDGRSSARRHAARGLAKVGASMCGAEATTALVRTLQVDPCPSVCHDAAHSLATIATTNSELRVNQDALGALAKVCDQDPTCNPCSQVLMRWLSAMSMPELLHIAASKESTIRVHAVKALAHRFQEHPQRFRWQVLPSLVRAVRSDPAWRVRESAAGALQRVCLADPAGAGADAVTTLAAILDDEGFLVSCNMQIPDLASETCVSSLALCRVAVAFARWRLVCLTAPSCSQDAPHRSKRAEVTSNWTLGPLPPIRRMVRASI
mmetsp:Transcript_99679/g.197632  ORF Transcript_99679/g.197632 Transcript_99679/m.197632 type:complete len:349 (+) Transcript_99679:71-1117(+)